MYLRQEVDNHQRHGDQREPRRDDADDDERRRNGEEIIEEGADVVRYAVVDRLDVFREAVQDTPERRRVVEADWRAQTAQQEVLVQRATRADAAVADDNGRYIGYEACKRNRL